APPRFLPSAPEKNQALMKKLSWLAVLVVAALIAGCNKDGDGTIKVGEFASLTGKEATFGTSSHEGTVLAVEELNAAGGVLGKKLELPTEDDLTKAGEA